MRRKIRREGKGGELSEQEEKEGNKNKKELP
jgi:hypothetical protein